MMPMKASCQRMLLLFLLVSVISCNQVEPPKAVGPVPADRHLAWHDMQYYAFVHFNMNTFTDMEWGTGGEKPE